MPRTARLVPLSLALAASLACAHAPGAPAAAAPRAPADFFPLAVGNTWVYADESPAAAAPERAPRTVRILERTADGYFRDDARGELRVDGGCLHDRVRRLLCGPVAVGTAWSSVVSVSSTERYEIASVDEQVETPAGRFAGCVKVRAHNRAGPDTDHVLEITYAPGVGPVRIETFVVAAGAVSPQVRAVLQSFQLGGK